jgi:riboflavin kinase/FMN adenylyltransferase
LIGFSGDLVGRSIELDFLARLRGTISFTSVVELVDQMKRDVAEAARIAASAQ